MHDLHEFLKGLTVQKDLRQSRWGGVFFLSTLIALSACQVLNVNLQANQKTTDLVKSQFLKQIADISLPGDTSRFDYQSFDRSSGYLYIAHLGAGHALVFDTKTQKVIADIANLPSVHGILAIPELHQVYASATGLNQVASIDPQTFKVKAMIPTGNYPDGLVYSPITQTVFVSNQFGKSNTVISTKTLQLIATIDLGGEVGNTQYDPGSGRIFTAVQTRNQLVAISPQTNQIVGRYDIPGCDRPHGLLIEPQQKQALIACEANAKLVVLSLKTMQVISTHPVGSGPDVLAFDPILHYLYVAAEDGTLSMFEQQSSDRLVKLEDIRVDPSAHTVAVDPQTHQVYLPLEKVGDRPVLRILQPSIHKTDKRSEAKS
jgi:DNA-binding beta-propeller fold protein YncE